MNKNVIKLGVICAAILGSLVILMTTGFSEGSILYAEVSDIRNNPDKFDGRGAKVTGTVVTGSVVTEPKLLTFHMQGLTSQDTIVVQYAGFIPDAFQEEATVIVEGKYNPDTQTISANKLLAKCPSRYEGLSPEEHSKAIEENNAQQL